MTRVYWYSCIYFTTQKDCRVSIYKSDKRNVIKHPRESDDSQKCKTFLKTEETGGEGEGEQESPHHFKSTKHLHYGRDGGGEGRPLVNFLKMKEGEGGRAGGNTLPFLKATDTTSIRGGGRF